MPGRLAPGQRFEHATNTDGKPEEPVPLRRRSYGAFQRVAVARRGQLRRVFLVGSPQAACRDVNSSTGKELFGTPQIGLGEASERFCRSLAVPIDHLCRNPVQANRMRPWFSHPRSMVELWTGAGHWIMQGRPDALNAAVMAWIGGL